MNPIVRSVLSSELRQLVRDRRALFAAVLLPALLYPLLFWGTEELERSGEELLAAREVLVALDLGAAPPEVADRARAAILQRTPIQVFEVDAQDLVTFEREEAGPLDPDLATAQRRTRYDRLLSGGGSALVTGDTDPDLPSRAVFHVYFDVKDDESREAADRAKEALGEVDVRLTEARRAELLGADPALGLDLEPVDVASAADASGAALGRWLPLLAVLVLLSGGSYAALAVFAGEREAGTLETLLVQPVPSRLVVLGKFLAVLCAGGVTLSTNLASLVVCGSLGLGDLPGFDGGATGPGLARLALGLVYLPGAVLVLAVLSLVCGKARTFREGQQTILPVMIVTALPTAIVMQPELETSLLLAALPFAGAALCVRDAMAGDLALTPAAVMWVAHAGWAWLVLTRLGVLLDAERVLSSGGSGDEDALRRASARHGLRWGFISVLLMYVVGVRLQQWDLEWGLGLTLWGLVLALALATAWRARGRRGGLAGELALGPPHPLHALAGLLCIPAALWAMGHLLTWQLEVLPMPASSQADATGLAILQWSTPLLVFLVAVSPGVCEEVLFRGALLSSLRRDLTPTRAVLWQALYFALMHLSVYRLLPTFLLGVALGALTLRARSVWPAVLAHAAYNATHILTQAERVDWSSRAAWPYLPWLALVGVGLLALPRGERAGPRA